MDPTEERVPPLKGGFRGIQPVLQKFLKSGLIQSCQFPDNIPILPVKKPNWDEYQFVQDLRAENDIVQDIHCIVPSAQPLYSVDHGAQR